MTEASTVAVTDHPFRDLDIERSILEPEGYSVAEHQCGTADEVQRRDLPLLRHDDVVVTAHQAFYSEEALRELQLKAAENLLRALETNS